MPADDVAELARVVVCTLAELEADEIRTLETRPPIAVYHVDGEVFALDDVCTHSFARLSEGAVDDGAVVCPLHMGEFDLRTGRPRCFPATVAVRTHPVEVVDGEVVVLLDRGTADTRVPE